MHKYKNLENLGYSLSLLVISFLKDFFAMIKKILIIEITLKKAYVRQVEFSKCPKAFVKTNFIFQILKYKYFCLNNIMK